jgi:hypothetical protein
MNNRQATCDCAPCTERELQARQWYIIEHTPIDGKIGRDLVDEFRRLVSIASHLTFTEQMMELDAFSASTAEQQRELLHRFAVDEREGAIEACIAANSELDELDAIIAATEPRGIPLAQVVTLARSG